MDRLHGLTIFVNVVETRSLSATARAMGVSPSAVSAAIGRLEQQLSARLLNRTTRSLSPTPEGAELYERGKRILAEMEELERSISQARRSPSGKLLIGMPAALGRMYVIPCLPEFTRAYPAVSVEIVLDNFPASIVGDGLDAAIQVGELPPSSLLVRKLASVDFVMCATPGYLAEHGTPLTPQDLAGHRCIAYRRPRNGQIRQWRLEGAPPLELHGARDAVTVNSGDGLTAAAASGLGIAQVARYYAQPLIDAGVLVELLPDHRPHAQDISVLFAATNRSTPRLRTFLDFLAAIFSRPPWRGASRSDPLDSAGGSGA